MALLSEYSGSVLRSKTVIGHIGDGGSNALTFVADMRYSLQSRHRRAGHRAYGRLYKHGGERLPGTAAHWKQLRYAIVPDNQKSIDSH